MADSRWELARTAAFGLFALQSRSLYNLATLSEYAGVVTWLWHCRLAKRQLLCPRHGALDFLTPYLGDAPPPMALSADSGFQAG